MRDSPKRDLGSVGVSGFALLDQEDEAREEGLANAGRRKAGMAADGVDCKALVAAPLLFDSMAIDVLESRCCSKSESWSRLEFEVSLKAFAPCASDRGLRFACGLCLSKFCGADKGEGYGCG